MSYPKRTKRKKQMRLDRLIEARKSKGLTQAEFAERIGVHARQVARYEVGENNPTIDVVIKMAKTLDCSIDWLAGLSDDTHGAIRLEDLPMDQRRVIIALRTLKDGPHKLQDLIRAIAAYEELLSDG